VSQVCNRVKRPIFEVASGRLRLRGAKRQCGIIGAKARLSFAPVARCTQPAQQCSASEHSVFNSIQTPSRVWAQVHFVPSRYGKATGPTRNRPPGATLQSRGSPIRCRVMLAVNPMSAVYPVHLQREIDRRWFHRSGTAPVRAARLKTLTDFFGVASVTPRLPTGASRLEVLQDSPRNIGSCSASASRMERGWHA
jgi:hypothetical protein